MIQVTQWNWGGCHIKAKALEARGLWCRHTFRSSRSRTGQEGLCRPPWLLPALEVGREARAPGGTQTPSHKFPRAPAA